MQAELIDPQDSTSLRRSNAIKTLDRAVSKAIAAGLSSDEALEIFQAGYGLLPTRGEIRRAADTTASVARLVSDPSGRPTPATDRGWLVFSLPHLTEPTWHAGATPPAANDDTVAVPIPEDRLDTSALADDVRIVLSAVVAKRRRRGPVRHAVDRPAALRDGRSIDDLRVDHDERWLAHCRSHAWIDELNPEQFDYLTRELRTMTPAQTIEVLEGVASS